MKSSLETALFFSVRYSALFLPIIVIAGLLNGGHWNYMGVYIVFGYYFLVEIILWATGLGLFSNDQNEFQFTRPGHPTWVDRYGVAIYGVIQIISIPIALFILSRPDISTMELVGGVLSMGIMVGSVGGLAGHEYIHRTVAWEKSLGTIIYGSVYYSHFTTSHLLGHHRHVGVWDDWSTARLGETCYSFFYRAFVHGYQGAWKIEQARLKRLKKSFWSWDNLMWRSTLATIILFGTIVHFLGWKAAALHVLISFIGVTLMEMVNYLSHYGLTREFQEKVTSQHSWESNNKVTNWFAFNSGKHCHHHTRPADPHFELLLANDKDCIPFGLPLMTLIAFIPPLYKHVMNQQLEKLS